MNVTFAAVADWIARVSAPLVTPATPLPVAKRIMVDVMTARIDPWDYRRIDEVWHRPSVDAIDAEDLRDMAWVALRNWDVACAAWRDGRWPSTSRRSRRRPPLELTAFWLSYYGMRRNDDGSVTVWHWDTEEA